VSPRRFARVGQGRGESQPALLLAALAGPAWLDAGIATPPTPLQALLGAVGFGERDALPTLRSNMVDRMAGRDRMVGWPVVLLQLVAESALRIV
jgi:hypothetical protein